MLRNQNSIIVICLLFLHGCQLKTDKSVITGDNYMNDSTRQFGYSREFLKKYTRVVQLRRDNASILVAPDWQGRVMTSTSEGDSGFSFGWINHDLISSGKKLPHINAFGGEERLWLGPEGGQFSIFFRKGTEFVYENWQTPEFIDTMPFDVEDVTETSIMLTKDISFENYSGTAFSVRLLRKVTILSDEEVFQKSGINTAGLNSVAYLSENSIINTGEEAWKKETGLLSVWMLGMFNPSPDVVVIIPVNKGDENRLGPIVNDNYFGKISSDRLRVNGNHIFFKADGKSRGKIGVPPLRTTGIMGSYDSENNILTLLYCKLPDEITDYVNSAWEIQDRPYSGDAFNSYNDGPLEDGSQMGPFYELETSSPAADLKPGQLLSHNEVTVHITGSPQLLGKLLSEVLGVSLAEIISAFN